MLFFLARLCNQLLRGHLRPHELVKTKDGLLSYNVPFRCWPIDMDAFMHMNNASYVRVAELARWAIFSQSKTLRSTFGSGILFLAVEQNVTYLKPINPFVRYYVNVSISSSDNKWIHYKHIFQSQPGGLESDKPPVVYAIVDCKAVLKEKSGKTVRVEQFVQNSEFYQQMLTNNDRIVSAPTDSP